MDKNKITAAAVKHDGDNLELAPFASQMDLIITSKSSWIPPKLESVFLVVVAGQIMTGRRPLESLSPFIISCQYMLHYASFLSAPSHTPDIKWDY